VNFIPFLLIASLFVLAGVLVGSETERAVRPELVLKIVEIGTGDLRVTHYFTTSRHAATPRIVGRVRGN